MKYTSEQLNEAVSERIFTKDQVDIFKNYIDKTYEKPSGLLNILFFGGGLLIISALTWLMKSSWDSFGAKGIVFFSAMYFVIFVISGYIVFFKNKMEIPGGLLFSIAIAVIPLLTFGIMKSLGFWPNDINYGDYYIWVKAKWIILEISTIFVAIIIFKATKFPFQVFLIAFTLWFLSMDIVPVLSQSNIITWTDRATISKIFGTFMLLFGYFMDIKFKKDYSFWLYLFGIITLTSGLSIFYNKETSMLILFGGVHLFFIILSIILERKVFLVFGTIGLIEFLSRLSYMFFKGSPVFPFVLTVIGLIIIGVGIFYQKNKKQIDEKSKRFIPNILLNLKPKRLR